jgi:hypothetical protein
MLTIGGMLLGAVLTAPVAAGGAAPADPFDPSVPQVAIAQSNAALGLRDPFAHDTGAITNRRIPRPSDVHADLLDPFDAARSSSPAPRTPSPSVAASAGSGADLRSPFEHAGRRRAQPPSGAAATRPDPQPATHSDLRDPFGR